MDQPKTPTYDPVHKLLHWLLFVLLAAQYAAGFALPDITSIDKVEGALAWHVALGPTILLLAILNLVWRILRPVPLPSSIPVWQRRFARATHDSLTLLLIVIPVLGWATASANSVPVKLFGLIVLPPLNLPPTWADGVDTAHVVLVEVMLVLIVLHIAAALYHYFVRKDGVLQRMLP